MGSIKIGFYKDFKRERFYSYLLIKLTYSARTEQQRFR